MDDKNCEPIPMGEIQLTRPEDYTSYRVANGLPVGNLDEENPSTNSDTKIGKNTPNSS